MADFYSPELENLKKSLLAQNWFQSPYMDLYKEQYQRLNQPVDIQKLANIAKSNILGQTRAGIQEATRAAGSRGFLPGQSGIADRAINTAVRLGQQATGEAISNIAANAQQQELERARAATGLLGQLGQQGLWGLSLGADIESRQRGMELDELMQFLNLIYGSYSGEQAAQLARYSPYWDALKTIYGG